MSDEECGVLGDECSGQACLGRENYRLFCAQVVSQAESSGRVLVLPDLAEVQGKQFDEATIIIANSVGGMEDIPVRHFLSSPDQQWLCDEILRAAATQDAQSL